MERKHQPGKSGKYWCNIFTTKSEIVVAICDEEILGKKLKFNNVDVKVSDKFYGGRLVDSDFAKKAMEKATIGNLFGEKIISIAQEDGFITAENIILIDGVPHAQFAKLRE